MLFFYYNKLRFCFRRITLALFCLTLAGCAALDLDTLTPIQKIQMEWAYARADALLEKARYIEAGEVLAEVAPEPPPPHRERMRLRSAKVLTDGNFLLNAFQQLKRIDEAVLTPSELLEKRILDARFYRQTNRLEKVLLSLPLEMIEDGDQSLQIISLGLRAEALFATRDYIGSVEMRIKRGHLLTGDAVPKNTTDLWYALIAESPENIEDRIKRGDTNRALRAWLEIARLATPYHIQRGLLEQEYADWKERYASLNVPVSLLESLRARWDYLDFHPKKIALLLPLTGEYVAPGKAIRDGFMQVHSTAESPPQVQVYNTDQPTSITEVYQRAVTEGADLVVGPLLKTKVDELMNQVEFTVPTIALNYHSQGHSNPRGELFQFGLLPEDDAVQVAKKMMEKGHLFAMIFVPDSEWGARMERAFTDEYLKQGGEVRDVVRYDTRFSDYAAVVQSGLRLDESRRRYRQVSDSIERKAKFIPRIRDDVTSAVMFSDYEKGVLIYPLIKFHYADDLAVFSTSHIYEPKKSKLLRELDGMIYCDIPAIINGTGPGFEENKHPRLFALGVDAYHLSAVIRRVALGNSSFDGMTGRIVLHSRHRLFRYLSWAKFDRGQPVSLGAGW